MNKVGNEIHFPPCSAPRGGNFVSKASYISTSAYTQAVSKVLGRSFWQGPNRPRFSHSGTQKGGLTSERRPSTVGDQPIIAKNAPYCSSMLVF